MSSIYISEPPTEGKVLLTTSAGEFDIELWSKEAPKAARNFIQLCLEGYYNGTIFHRVIPTFIVQGGDPLGTGEGGESIYGKPFKDEFHSRLRFVRRGLVAMANAGPNDNGSQFFFSLGPCQELQNKHTIFGKLAGKTQYNLSRFEEGEIEDNDRPAFPHKILKTEVLSNPFPDIEPRVKIENEIPQMKKRKKKGTKNFKLLSFGDEAEEEEEEVMALTKSLGTKGTSAHDIAQDPTLSAKTSDVEAANISALERIRKRLKGNETKPEKSEDYIEDKRKLETDSSNENASTIIDSATSDQDEEQSRKIEDMKAENLRLMRELKGKTAKPEKVTEAPKMNQDKESDALKDYYKERSVYEDIRGKQPKKGKDREKITLVEFDRFRAKLQNFLDGSDEENDNPEENEDDNSDAWLRQKVTFRSEAAPVLAKDASTKNASWYDVNDPRNAIAKRRRDEDSRSKKKSKH